MKIMNEDYKANYPTWDASIPEEAGYFAGTQRFYGNFKCSKCGEVLGQPYAQFNPKQDVALIVGEADDDEGVNWRSFCYKCAPGIANSGMTPTEIMKIYPVAPYVDGE